MFGQDIKLGWVEGFFHVFNGAGSVGVVSQVLPAEGSLHFGFQAPLVASFFCPYILFLPLYTQTTLSLFPSTSPGFLMEDQCCESSSEGSRAVHLIAAKHHFKSREVAVALKVADFGYFS